MPVLLFLITVLFFWRLTLTSQYTWLEGPDNARELLPWFQAQCEQWHNHHFPLWDPHTWAGQPIPGQVQLGALNPLNWLMFSVPLSHGRMRIDAFHFFYVFIHYLAALFTYMLCRDLRLSQAASVLGGIAFGMGGFMGTVGFLQREMGALWIPLILLFFFRMLRGERTLANAAVSGALLGISFLSGHHDVPMFMTLTMAALWIYYYAVIQRPTQWRALLPGLAFAACFVLIAAAQILPATELGKASVRWAGTPEPLGWNEKVPYNVHEQFSLYPTSLLGIILPGFQKGVAIFLGFTALSLAAIGSVISWRDRSVRVILAIAVGTLLFAMGAYGLYHGVLYALIPGLDKSRSPVAAAAIVNAAAAVLAAFGLEAFLRLPVEVEACRRVAVRVLLPIGGLLYAALTVLITVRPETSEEYKFLAQAAMVAVMLGALFALWTPSRLSARAGAVLAILVLLFELNTVSNYGMWPRDRPGSEFHKLFENTDVVAFLKRQTQPIRVDVDEKVIPYGYGDWWGIDEFGGPGPSMLSYLATVQGSPVIRDLMATGFHVGNTPSRPNQVSVFDAASGAHVYRNPDALPRLRTVHEALGLPEKEFGYALESPALHRDRTVLLLGDAPALETCDAGDQIQTRAWEPARITVDVTMRCRGMLILADTWFTGWHAYVDGREVRIYKAYNLVRGVVVDAGQHRVAFRYLPGSVFAGAALALAGLILCVGLQFTERRHLAAEAV
jgi:hypothetical protein